uniref:Uncharacterized protein n=1 Tax=Triticum urartu TaxID=4572 RepID=A0A8R7V755_TRIUA
MLPGPMMAMWPCTWVLVICSVQRNGRRGIFLCWMSQQAQATPTADVPYMPPLAPSPINRRIPCCLSQFCRFQQTAIALTIPFFLQHLTAGKLLSSAEIRVACSAAKAGGHGRRQPGDDGQRAEGVPVRAGAQGAGPGRHQELMVQRLPLQPQLRRRGGQGRRPLVRLRAHHAPGLLPLQAPPPERRPPRRRRSRASAAHG